MPQSLTKVWVHIIFSTKNRFAYLTNLENRERLYEYLAGACKALNCPAVTIGGVADHVHILCAVSKTLTLSKLVEELKRSSSKWLKTFAHSGFGDYMGLFYWQKGYGAFSVSKSAVEAVRNYIDNQVKHHKKITFQDEYRKLLKCYGIKYDERYVWD